MTIHGHGSGNNEYVFTGAKSYPKKTTKSTISKSITYNGKTSTANTLKDKDDTMVYNVNATVSAKKGAYITDALPHRFTVTKVSSVTNFSHNSVASINSSHQFKATLNNDKLDGKNKKVTFHITGNMGTWMDKHPSMVDGLKWPVANTAYWYQKSTGKLKSNKVTTNYKNGGTKGKVTFNFIDFDNHGRKLKTKKTITSLGTGKTDGTQAIYTHAKFLKDQWTEALTVGRTVKFGSGEKFDVNQVK